ncbi:MAG TPA: helix-turn-helix domain-containing protein [Rudaea sp.]|nr:helix-turn-helix domain-containing protein [Rudaea sp.]
MANHWMRRLLAGTRGRILAELRRRPGTVNELTDRLAISANAVRSHLAALERDGIVAIEPLPRHGVGKPAHQYRLTGEAQSLTPKAYDTMLDVVLTSARERAGAEGYAQILQSAADRLAGGEPDEAGFEARLVDTKAFLAKVGADVEIERSGNKVRFRGADCPLASMVAAHPELCGVLAAVIARRLGVEVHDCCDRSVTLPRCCFEAIVA